MSDDHLQLTGAIGFDESDVPGGLPRSGASRSRAWLVLALVFLAGAGLGSAITASVLNQRWRQFAEHPERMPERIVRELAEQLRLDAAQSRRIAAIVNERHQDFERIRAEIHPRASANFDRMEREIAAELRDDQRPAWEAWVVEKRKRFPPPPPQSEPHPNQAKGTASE